MLDSFPVLTEFSRTRTMILRSLFAATIAAILYYNTVSTCSPRFESTYSQDCSKALVPVGSQFTYEHFKMINLAQVDYDGFTPEGCRLENVMIRLFFATAMAPTFNMNMIMNCQKGITLSISDITFVYWDQYYDEIVAAARYYKSVLNREAVEAVEFKHYWSNGRDNDTRFFVGDSLIVNAGPNSTNLDRKYFFEMMKLALDDVQNATLPGVRYLCSHCGRNAEWPGQNGALLWRFILNTVNTIASSYGILVFALSLRQRNHFSNLLKLELDKEKEKEKKDEESSMESMT